MTGDVEPEPHRERWVVMADERDAAIERADKAEERAHHFLSALESARALIERDVPKEILLDNIRRNLDDAKRGAA